MTAAELEALSKLCDAATPESAAKAFHDSYERLAPSFGYETRKESAVPWSMVPENNRRLMVAVCEDVLSEGVAGLSALIAEVKRLMEVNGREIANVSLLRAENGGLKADLKAYDAREVDRCAAYAKSNGKLMVENAALKQDAAWYRLVCNRIGRDTLTDRAYCDIDAAVCALDDHGIKPGDFDARIRELINMYETAEMSRVELAGQNEALEAEMARLVVGDKCTNCGGTCNVRVCGACSGAPEGKP